ncbi:RNA 2',3'-cyclic phosphodiesterase [Marinobacter sp. JSM 1782161]|uniref:RNA 2',3'-cyclic phosphodiesterase n=1 Tax=Marinobacter sp. JSM 1782161 TaxID=2685906 RepID=UPI0014023C9F|nr:RNA 2',3'-cyclic phosphodiesterase [Marinobacter sp. JSM 1782161]
MLRLFVGLELPDAIKHSLVAIRSNLKGARWQTTDQLHLTLCFIGNLDDDHLPAIYDALHGLTVTPFNLTVEGIGLFGSSQHPKNLWVGVREEAAVATLHDELHRRLAPLDIEPQGRAYHPHITLARFRGRRTRQYAARQDKREPPSGLRELLQQHQGLSLPPFGVDHVSLFSSTRRPEGSHYQVIGRFPAD